MRDDSYINYILNEMRNQQQGGNVDLFNRPQIDASLLGDTWNAGDGVATVYSSTYSNPMGQAANFTPIVADRGGNYVRSLSEPELTAYAEGVMSGRPDSMGLQIGPVYNSVAEAENNAEKVHRLQDLYYNGLKNMRNEYVR